jgi:hypothetical protein
VIVCCEVCLEKMNVFQCVPTHTVLSTVRGRFSLSTIRQFCRGLRIIDVDCGMCCEVERSVPYIKTDTAKME